RGLGARDLRGVGRGHAGSGDRDRDRRARYATRVARRSRERAVARREVRLSTRTTVVDRPDDGPRHGFAHGDPGPVVGAVADGGRWLQSHRGGEPSARDGPDYACRLRARRARFDVARKDRDCAAASGGGRLRPATPDARADRHPRLAVYLCRVGALRAHRHGEHPRLPPSERGVFERARRPGEHGTQPGDVLDHVRGPVGHRRDRRRGADGFCVGPRARIAGRVRARARCGSGRVCLVPAGLATTRRRGSAGGRRDVTRLPSLRELLDEAAGCAAAGRIDDALAAYAAALADSPHLAEAHYNVAALRLAKGDLAGAQTGLDEALRLKPDWPQGLQSLGRLHLRQGRLVDAERAFARAVELASDSTEALVQHANVLDRLRRWPEALPLLKRARALAPDSEEIWFALRGHLLLFNRHDEAFEDFRAFEPRAKLSARIVAAGLFSARI